MIVVELANDLELLREALEALPDTDKLELLAQWLDVKDNESGYTGDREVQRDLRAWATRARAAITKLEQRLLEE